MTGAEIKTMIKSNGVMLWEVADRLGMTDNYFSRRLRKPFTEVEVAKIRLIIKEIKLEKSEEMHEITYDELIKHLSGEDYQTETLELLKHKGFDITSKEGLEKALKWLETEDPNYLFWNDPKGDEDDSDIGEAHRPFRIAAVKRYMKKMEE